MKFSVLIAAYRAGKYIAKALESIHAQSHADWELVVVEDGSRDETESLVKVFAERTGKPVRYDNLGQNQGVAVARSRLLQLAEGEAVAFLDADDWWTATHLERANDVLGAGADVAVARIQLFDLEAARPIETYAASGILFANPVAALFRYSHVITSSCIALRKTLTTRVGDFDGSFRIGEDRDYWLRCALEGARFADTGEITCVYSKHTTSTMGRTLLWSQQEVAFYEKYRDLPAVPASLRRGCLSHGLANYGRLLRASDPRASAKALWRAWSLAPAKLSLLPQTLLSVSRAAAPRGR